MNHSIRVVLFLLGLLPLAGFAQRNKIDSLQRVLAANIADTEKAKTYGNLASAYYAISPDSFFIFCHKGLALAKQLKWKKQVARLNMKMSSMLTDTGNYTLALKYDQESLSINQELGLTTEVINNYIGIGRTYDFQSDFVKSSDYFFKAMSMAEKINDHEKMAIIGTNLSACFYNQQDFKKAEQYGLVTLREAELAASQPQIYKASYILGAIKTSLGDTVAAISYYEKAIAVSRKNGFTLSEAEAVTDLARIQKDNQKTIALLLQARGIYDQLSPGAFGSIDNWESLGDAYISLYKSGKGKQDTCLEKAAGYIGKMINKCKESNNTASFSRGINLLSTVEELRGNYHQAYLYSKQFHRINDSIFSQENKNKIAALEGQRAIDLKNKEIENKELQIGNQQKRLWLLVSFVAFLAIVGFLLYRQGIARKKNNRALQLLNTELADANKVKSKFFGILSHDLRSPLANLLNFLQLQKRKPGLMSAEAVAAREDKIAASATSLLDTMETMLLWSKGQMEHFKPVLSTVAAADLFAYLQKFFADVEHIAFVFMDEEKTTLQTDEHYLKTILHNLTANAVKALQQTPGASITWKAWKAGTNTYFSITDNGPGAGNEQLKALYDETASAGTQHGLGLHIIRDLAKAIKCNVVLQPKKDRGTEFILSL